MRRGLNVAKSMIGVREDNENKYTLETLKERLIFSVSKIYVKGAMLGPIIILDPYKIASRIIVVTR